MGRGPDSRRSGAGRRHGAASVEMIAGAGGGILAVAIGCVLLVPTRSIRCGTGMFGVDVRGRDDPSVPEAPVLAAIPRVMHR